MERAIITKFDGGKDGDGGFEAIRLAWFHWLGVNIGLADGGEVVFGHRLLIALVNQVVQTFLIDGVFADHALQHGARGVPAPEARNCIFLGQLMISSVRGFFYLVPVEFYVQDGLTLGGLFDGDLHTFLQP